LEKEIQVTIILPMKNKLKKNVKGRKRGSNWIKANKKILGEMQEVSLAEPVFLWRGGEKLGRGKGVAGFLKGPRGLAQPSNQV